MGGSHPQDLMKLVKLYSSTTVDGSSPANQLRLVVYPIKNFVHPRWWRISSINSRTPLKTLRFLENTYCEAGCHISRIHRISFLHPWKKKLTMGINTSRHAIKRKTSPFLRTIAQQFSHNCCFFWVLKAWGLGPWFQPWPPIDKRRRPKPCELGVRRLVWASHKDADELGCLLCPIILTCLWQSGRGLVSRIGFLVPRHFERSKKPPLMFPWETAVVTDP